MTLSLPVPHPHAEEQLHPESRVQLDRPERVVQLTGPHGTGKRTALAQWARTQRNVVWACGRVRHADTRLLLLDLAHSAQQAGLPTPAFDQAALLTGTREALTAAFIRDVRAPGQPVTLCIEDASVPTDDAVRLLAHITAHLPEGCRMRVTSTRDLREHFALFLPDREIHTVTFGPDLRQECQEAILRGNVAALGTDDHAVLVTAAAQGGVLPDAPGVRALTDRLIAAGLPIINRGPTVNLHPCLNALLESQHAGSADWTAAARSAARQAEREGVLLNAAALYLRAGDVSSAADLLEPLAARWAERFDWPPVRYALSALPEEALTPVLRGLLARALIETGEGESGNALATPSRHPTALLARIVHAARSGRQGAVHALIEEGLQVATDARDVIHLLIQSGNAAATSEDPREVEQALQALQEAEGRARAISDAALQVTALLTRGYVLTSQRRPDEARGVLMAAAQAARAQQLTRNMGHALELLCDLDLQAGRTAEARQVMTESLTDAVITDPVLLSRVHALHMRLNVLEGKGDAVAELARRAFAASFGAGDLLGARYAALHLVPLLALTGDVASARQVTDTLHARLEWQQVPLLTHSYHVFEAYLAFGAGDHAGALAHLNASAPQDDGARPTITWALEVALRDLLGPGGTPRAPWPGDDARLAATVRLIHAHASGEEAPGTDAPAPQSTPDPLEVKVRTLGQIGAWVGGREVVVYRPALIALAYRLLHPHARQDEIATQVWPDATDAQGRMSASRARTDLNRALQVASPAALAEVEVLRGGRRGQRNPEWTVHPDVTMTLDVHGLLASTDPDVVGRAGEFLPGVEGEWIEGIRAQIRAHQVMLGVVGAPAAD